MSAEGTCLWHGGGATHQLLAVASSAHSPSPVPCWKEALLWSLSSRALCAGGEAEEESQVKGGVSDYVVGKQWVWPAGFTSREARRENAGMLLW